MDKVQAIKIKKRAKKWFNFFMKLESNLTISIYKAGMDKKLWTYRITDGKYILPRPQFIYRLYHNKITAVRNAIKCLIKNGYN